ncbi:OmpA/MotB family protein [Amnibacterium kyonggiense]|uniref:Chemotaxis protein MotB n=1 Tax=Amnibacterium kyonggiense TaxID=595671 RepID=A0A4R7FQL6_9MICO|nr:flagellar motor protein MotB [Amnibacterium kyonggiense]TDS80082.1 chemotaxis protein MotB [Amnibacterium kyonggiense]
MSGRRRKGHAEEHHVDERWLVSYADMITVLMALFIVLYALSTVNQKKFDELKNSLASGFGTKKSTKVDQNSGIVRPEDVAKHGSGFSNSTIAVMMAAKEITDELKSAGLANKVTVDAGSNSITLSLVGASTYFGGNDANLQPQALTVLKKLSPTLERHAGVVTVEGHADPRGSAGEWGTDWLLAAARANSVGQYLIDDKAIDPANISFTSFGSQNAKKGTSQAAIEHNRRVDIVLHSVQVPAAASDATAGSKEAASTESASTEGASKEASAEEPAKTAEHAEESASSHH